MKGGEGEACKPIVVVLCWSAVRLLVGFSRDVRPAFDASTFVYVAFVAPTNLQNVTGKKQPAFGCVCVSLRFAYSVIRPLVLTDRSFCCMLPVAPTLMDGTACAV